MVSAFLLQSPYRSQDIKGVVHEEVLLWYLRLYFNLRICLRISRGVIHEEVLSWYLCLYFNH